MSFLYEWEDLADECDADDCTYFGGSYENLFEIEHKIEAVKQAVEQGRNPDEYYKKLIESENPYIIRDARDAFLDMLATLPLK